MKKTVKERLNDLFMETRTKVFQVLKQIGNYISFVSKALWEHLCEWIKKTKVIQRKAKEINAAISTVAKENSYAERKFTEAIKLLEESYDKGIKVDEIDEFVNYIMNVRKRKEYSKYSDAERVQEDISSWKIIETIPNPNYKKPQLTQWAIENRKKLEGYLEQKKLYNKILSDKGILNVDITSDMGGYNK